jgi:murein DD-endopeptidase MepM/ murein hydrolase activator NlpD
MAGGTGRLTTQFDFGVTAAQQQPGTVDVRNPMLQLSEDLARFDQAFGSIFRAHDQKAGQREGAAAAEAVASGETSTLDYNFFERFLAPARYDAAQAAFGAGIKSDIDKQEKEIRSQFAFDPEGYKAASDAMIDGYISRAPSDWAMDVGGYVRDKANDGFGAVTKARTEKDQAENVATVQAREATLREDIVALAGMAGGTDTVQFDEAMLSYQLIQAAKGNNPLFKWTPEQAAREYDKLYDDVQMEVVKREATDVYTASGGGQAGKVASLRYLGEVFGYDTGPKGAAPKGSVPFTMPVQGPVSSKFGAARASGAHGGMDITVPVGTPITVAGPGVVIGVGEDEASGKFVRVRHADGTITSYAHLSAQDVKRGDALAAGAVLGKSGNTGNSTGPHLHFRVRDANGKVIDPESIIGKEALAGGPVEEESTPAAQVDLAPGKRQKYYNAAAAHVRSISTADMEEVRLNEQREAAARVERRTITADYQLDIMDGQKPDWRNDDRLTDVEKIRLEKAERQEESRAYTEAQRDKAAQKASSGASYLKLRDMASDGTLTDERLADAVAADEITKAEAQTLRGRNNSALKMEIDQVEQGMGTKWFDRPGWPSAKKGEAKAKADKAIRDWVVANPDATAERRAQAGANIRNWILGDGGASQKAGAAPATDKAARLSALKKDYEAGKFSQTEYTKRRKAILGS